MREDYFNLLEAAKELGISDSSLRRIVDNVPNFPALRLGGRWIVKKKPLYAWFEDAENRRMVENMFNRRVSIDYMRLRENSKRYDQQVAHRGTLQSILRAEEKNRMYKTHLEF